MTLIKALLIAPYPGLVEIAKNLQIPNYMQLDIQTANLEQGVEIARNAERQGYEIIISRGGTATMIQDEVSLPVVHIDITGYDMLRVFTLISGLQKKVALVGFANISRGAATLCNILELNVKMITIQSRSEVKHHLQELKQEGYSVIIGDVVTVQEAKQLGLRGVLITSGKEALMDAFEETKRLHHLANKIRYQTKYLSDMFAALPIPAVIIDESKQIVDYNNVFQVHPRYKEILHTKQLNNIIRKVLSSGADCWSEIKGENQVFMTQAYKVNEEDSLVGILVHAEVEKPENVHLKVTSHPSPLPIIGDSEQSKSLTNNMPTYASTNHSIYIYGEIGTGKKTLAKIIHFERFGSHVPIIEVAGSLNHAELNSLKKLVRTIKQATLLLRDADKMSKSEQSSLLKIVSNKSIDVQVISVSNASIEKLVKKGAFSQKLYDQLTDHTIHMIPLRERKRDIPAFINYFLAEFHTDSGYEAIGMKEDAMELLMQLEWELNVAQLKKVCRELSLMTTGYYIEAKHVEKLIQNKGIGDFSIPIEGTLMEMEQRVIKRVLEEENNNQSNAAKRLGISRTTLWRKLHNEG